MAIWHGPTLRRSTVLTQRAGGVVQVRSPDGAWVIVERRLRSYDTMLAEIADPRAAPEVLTVREQVRSWRFYDHLRTDADAPARATTQTGTRTPVLGPDGADLAAARQTIKEVGDAEGLTGHIDRAFPGSHLGIVDDRGQFTLTLSQPGLLRPMRAVELSDGTLRYLLLVPPSSPLGPRSC